MKTIRHLPIKKPEMNVSSLPLKRTEPGHRKRDRPAWKCLRTPRGAWGAENIGDHLR